VRTYIWRLSGTDDRKFRELLLQLEEHQEDSDEAYAIRDEIRSIPGHPPGTDTYDYIIREITTLG